MDTKEGTRNTPTLKFDKEDSAINDICLIVGGQKFYCSKLHLSHHSEYFRTMFNADFKEKTKREIHLRDVEKPKDFQAYLELINGVEWCINDENIHGLLHMASVWITPIVRSRCIEFLLNSEKKSVKELLELAEKYKMEELMVGAIAEIRDPHELSEAVPEDFSTLNDTTKNELLKKSMELLGVYDSNNYSENSSPAPQPNHSIHMEINAQNGAIVEVARPGGFYIQELDQHYRRQQQARAQHQQQLGAQYPNYMGYVNGYQFYPPQINYYPPQPQQQVPPQPGPTYPPFPNGNQGNIPAQQNMMHVVPNQQPQHNHRPAPAPVARQERTIPAVAQAFAQAVAQAVAQGQNPARAPAAQAAAPAAARAAAPAQAAQPQRQNQGQNR
uniref:BTB domain-containing protein n=1 Tax=Caenorhabditis tropicalis TaxID=1561998 RepID=A0A1I7TCL6_9PELO